MSLKEKVLNYYNQHELKLHIGFFVFGFIFDYLTAGEVDDLWVIGQQIFYLGAIFLILTFDHLSSLGLVAVSQRVNKIWEYRGLVLHFFLGSVLNLYSLFFLKSASVFNSIIFVFFLLAIVIANELPQIQKRGVDLKWALFVLCLFCFYTILFPTVLGFVGWLPFLLSASATVLSLYVHLRILMRYQKNFQELSRVFLKPGFFVVAVFVSLYFIGLIPPVPLAVQDMGFYHQLKKENGAYFLSHEKPWWKFWQTGDQDFSFRPGDPVYFFAQVFSPARFSDEVVIHWLFKDPKAGWTTSDQVKMSVSGGRRQGFRGYAVKKNYQAGDWRVQVETTDGREIGRIYLHLTPDTSAGDRVWQIDRF